MIAKALKSFSTFDVKLLSILSDLTTYGIHIYEKPSFHTISKIIASPQKMLQFKEIVFTLSDSLEEMLVENDNTYVQSAGVKLRPIFAQILTLQKTLKDSDRFTLSRDKSDTNSGNNAVLQHLDNTIASYAKKDYVNTNEYSIDTLMQKNAIIIVDTQSFGEDVMKIFFESILKKAVMRLRTGSTTPLSVFIDEANRVLSPNIDLHNDVLREASVELILAIQNEEQMINKFTKTVWDSIKLNIKHQYMIDIEHRIFYNGGEFMSTDPMQLEDNVLLDAEYSYYDMEKNQQNIKKHFLAKSDFLPERFTVVYDIDMFEHESAVFLEDREGSKYLYRYHGEEIVNKMRSFYAIETEIPSATAFTEDVEDYSEMTFLEELGLFYDEVEKESEENEEYCYDYDDDNLF